MVHANDHRERSGDRWIIEYRVIRSAEGEKGRGRRGREGNRERKRETEREGERERERESV